MKTFAELRESKDKATSGKMVFNKKIGGVPVMIHKEANGFIVYIDGDKLDSYKSQKEAEKMAAEFVKQYKG
jgi:hypothetical protein